jgi:hypothetical protein
MVSSASTGSGAHPCVEMYANKIVDGEGSEGDGPSQHLGPIVLAGGAGPDRSNIRSDHRPLQSQQWRRGGACSPGHPKRKPPSELRGFRPRTGAWGEGAGPRLPQQRHKRSAVPMGARKESPRTRQSGYCAIAFRPAAVICSQTTIFSGSLRGVTVGCILANPSSTRSVS